MRRHSENALAVARFLEGSAESHGLAGVDEALVGAVRVRAPGWLSPAGHAYHPRMPDIDGMEVLRNIRAENLAEKVIMLTGVNELKIARFQGARVAEIAKKLSA